MSEYYVTIDLTAPPTVPQFIPESNGVPITGVIVNNQLPAGLQLKVCRKGGSDGVVLAGAPSATTGGDALLDFFCPPAREGIAVIWNIAAPGAFARLVLVSDGSDASLSRA